MPTKTKENKEKTNIFIPLTNDLLFKETFGKKGNERFIEMFLERYFNLPKYSLKGKVKVSYEYHFEKKKYKDKAIRGDLCCIIEDNLIVQIEMYKVLNKTSTLKSDCYVMRLATSIVKIGNDYIATKDIVQLNLFKKRKCNIKNKYLYGNSDYLKSYYISLDNIDENLYTDNESYIRLLKFIGAETKKERDKIAKGDEELMDINKWIEKYTNDKATTDIFNDELWNQAIAHEDGYDEGRNVGRNEGRSEGELFKAKYIANNLLQTDMELEDIAKATGLSLDEITSLNLTRKKQFKR